MWSNVLRNGDFKDTQDALNFYGMHAMQEGAAEEATVQPSGSVAKPGPDLEAHAASLGWKATGDGTYTGPNGQRGRNLRMEGGRVKLDPA